MTDTSRGVVESILDDWVAQASDRDNRDPIKSQILREARTLRALLEERDMANLAARYESDLAEQALQEMRIQKARVKQMEGLLREAREDLGAYLDADYPEGSRAKYPEIRRRWNRDMDLCRRIDEAINPKGTDNAK